MLYCLVKENYLGRLRDTYVGGGSEAMGLLHKDFYKIYGHGRTETKPNYPYGVHSYVTHI